MIKKGMIFHIEDPVEFIYIKNIHADKATVVSIDSDVTSSDPEFIYTIDIKEYKNFFDNNEVVVNNPQIHKQIIRNLF